MCGHSTSHPDENSDPDGNRKRSQRAVLALVRDSLQSIIAELGAEFGRIMAETYGFVLGQAPAAANAVDDFIHRGRDGIADLVSGRRHACRGAAAGPSPDLINLILERVQAASGAGNFPCNGGRRLGKQGACALTGDSSGADSSGADSPGADSSGADSSGADSSGADSSRAVTAGSRARLFDGVKPRARKQRRAVRWVPLRNQSPIRRLAFHQSFVGANPWTKIA